MGEDRTQGAGGRVIQTSPIIADVWAEADEEVSVGERAGGQALSHRARFTLAYSKPYLAARFVEWQGRRYRVSSLKAVGVKDRQIDIAAQEIN
jgi:hypothetical protein